MVKHPGDCNWSSYYTNAQDKPNTVITPHPLYERLGSTKAKKQRACRELFRYLVKTVL
jgi:putative transposase